MKEKKAKLNRRKNIRTQQSKLDDKNFLYISGNVHVGRLCSG